MKGLAHILERATLYHRRRPAISDNVAVMDYGQLAKRVHRLAGAMASKGLKPGDRIAILARNSFRYIEVNLACAHAGIILVPLNIRLAAAEITRILARTEAKAIFRSLPCEVANVEVIAWSDEEKPGGNGDYERMIAAGPMMVEPHRSALDDVAQIFFTSGTTGEPKGVCLTHRNLIASSLDSIIAMELNPQDIWFHSAPMFHLVDAFAIWAISMVGGRHVTQHFEPASFAETVAREGITKASLPPTLLDMIARHPDTAKHDVGTLERISYGGSPMPRAVYDRTRAALGCHLVQAYGITESAGLVCHQFPHDVNLDNPSRQNSVGQPVLHVELKIIDNDGSALLPGDIGELVVRGDHVMAGYWRDPKATAAAIPDGWYRTGDLGVADDDGHVTVVGRKKEMIISGGENVYPAEVENALLLHPLIAEAAVFGVPSERWGEEVRAVVLMVECASLDAKAVTDHCRALIAGYKVPKSIDFAAESLPKSGPGKVAKNLVREAYLKGFEA